MKSIKEIKKNPNLQPKLVIAADQMIGNLSMKIGEVDSGSADDGGEICHWPSLALLAKDTFLLSSYIWHHC